MVINIRKVFLLLILILIANCALVASYSEEYPSKLLESDRSIGNFTIGKSSLVKAKERYGGILTKEKSIDLQSFNRLCLLVADGREMYVLTLESGAMGGWDIITKYKIEVLNKEAGLSNCGNYNEKNISFGWRSYNISDVMQMYGKTKLVNNQLKYVYKYKVNYPDTNSAYFNYSGITYMFNDTGKVIMIDVFEVEST